MFQYFFIFGPKAVLVSYMYVLKMWRKTSLWTSNGHTVGRSSVIVLWRQLPYSLLSHSFRTQSFNEYHEPLSFFLSIYLTVEMLTFKVKTEK